MNRDEFMARLSELLSDVNEAEKEEALKYYRDYFDDAGIWNEQNVINELVSPEKVAETIKESLGSESFCESFEYGETGTAEASAEIIDVSDSEQKDSSSTSDSRKKTSSSNKKDGGYSTTTVILIVIACIILSPIIASVVSSIFGAAVAVVSVIIVLSLMIAVGPFALTVFGIAAVVAGVIEYMSNAAIGALMAGIGFISIGVSLIGYVIFWLYFFKLVPKFFRWLSSLGTKKKGGRN